MGKLQCCRRCELIFENCDKNKIDGCPLHSKLHKIEQSACLSEFRHHEEERVVVWAVAYLLGLGCPYIGRLTLPMCRIGCHLLDSTHQDVELAEFFS